MIMLAIPLEDHFFDVIAKSQRGLGLSDEALSNRAGIRLTALEELKKTGLWRCVIKSR
jgi:hypothetical protein